MNVKKLTIVAIVPFILYICAGHFVYERSIDEIIFYAMFFTVGFGLLYVVSSFMIMGTKHKLTIIDYTRGSGGNAAIGFIGNGKKYVFRYELDSIQYRSQSSYASMFSHNKGDEVTGFKNRDYFAISKDLYVLLYFGAMLIYPSLEIFL